MNGLLFLIPAGALVALVFAVILVFSIFKTSEGTDRMIEIADAVREGAAAYLKRQYMAVAVFFAVVFVILLVLSSQGYLGQFVPYAFLMGGFLSGLSGFFGMKIATNSSARTAQACQSSLNKGLRLAFSSGCVMGFTVVGLGLLSVFVWYFGLDAYYSANPLPEGHSKLTAITSTMLCLGMGASFMALFARVGGGIFTKAADVMDYISYDVKIARIREWIRQATVITVATSPYFIDQKRAINIVKELFA